MTGRRHVRSARFEGKAWATVNISGQADLFVGRPVLVDNPELFLQVTQSGKNPGLLKSTTRPMRPSPRAFGRIRPSILYETPSCRGPVTIPAGGSMICTL